MAFNRPGWQHPPFYVRSFYYLFDEEGAELTIEEVHSLCSKDLQCADNHYECDEDYNGILLNDLERLDEEEMAEAANVMCDALVDYYFDIDSDLDEELEETTDKLSFSLYAAQA